MKKVADLKVPKGPRRGGARDTPNRVRRLYSAGVRKSEGGGTKDFLVTLLLN